MKNKLSKEDKALEASALLEHILEAYGDKRVPVEQSNLDFISVLERFLGDSVGSDEAPQQLKFRRLVKELSSRIKKDFEKKRPLKQRSESIQKAAIIDMLIVRGADRVAARKAIRGMSAAAPRTYRLLDEMYCIVDELKNGKRVRSADAKYQERRFRPYIAIRPVDFFSILNVEHRKFITDDKKTMHAWNELLNEMKAAPSDEPIVELPNDVILPDKK